MKIGPFDPQPAIDVRPRGLVVVSGIAPLDTLIRHRTRGDLRVATWTPEPARNEERARTLRSFTESLHRDLAGVPFGYVAGHSTSRAVLTAASWDRGDLGALVVVGGAAGRRTAVWSAASAPALILIPDASRQTLRAGRKLAAALGGEAEVRELRGGGVSSALADMAAWWLRRHLLAEARVDERFEALVDHVSSRPRSRLVARTIPAAILAISGLGVLPSSAAAPGCSTELAGSALTISCGAGDDTVSLTSTKAGDILMNGASIAGGPTVDNTETIAGSGNAGADRFAVRLEGGGFSGGNEIKFLFSGGAGDDTVAVAGNGLDNPIKFTIKGSTVNINLIGDSRPDVRAKATERLEAAGGGGNDTVRGVLDSISVKYLKAQGDAGADLIRITPVLTSSKVEIEGFGGIGNDTLSVVNTSPGAPDAVTLSGGEGGDRLTGGAENDVLFGMAGKDTLNGGPGDDTGNGGAGADTCTSIEHPTSC